MSKKLTIEEMQVIAKNRGGKCLSSEYVNGQTKLKWQCKDGHVWEAKPQSVKSGDWCSFCSGKKKLSIEFFKELAKKKGGLCLSREYVNSHTKLEWECSKGHRWMSVAYQVKNNDVWCPECAGVVRFDIQQMQELAKSRGGKCLSKRYLNGRTKLEWECKQGHRWKAQPASVRNGRWCPECSIGISERYSRQVMELMFGVPFPRLKPVWLLNSRGNRMELDGYSERLNLAFEHQGEQHYRSDNYFHKNNKDSLKKRVSDDEYKKEICKQNGVYLIGIPYFVKKEDVPQYIKDNVPKKYKVLIKNISDLHISGNFYIPDDILKELTEIAKGKGGELVSDSYFGNLVPLEWRCKEGHTWKATPKGIKNMYWCPYCSGKKKKSIEEMHEYAKSRGGVCLSKKYVNKKNKLKWRCAKGHVWETSSDGIVDKKRWCPKCVFESRKNTIEQMKRIAKERGGKCLSKKYVDGRTKLRWECEKGHVWEARPTQIKHAGGWCKDCYFEGRRGNIQEMREIAKERGGECLSKNYTNSRTSLKWRCEKGHVWSQIPKNIKAGSWCNVCNK